MKNAFEGPASGPGAIFRWDGDSKVGAGAMTILETQPGSFIKIKIDFLKPFVGTNTVEFTFKPEGNQTAVTWAMYGKQPFIGKAITLVMNCDKMIGGYYEKGLASLKTVSEASVKN